MGWFSKIIGTGNPIEAIGKAGDALFTSDEERGQLQNDLAEIKQKPLLMQALANVAAANHRSSFVAGGRPALLWVAALGLFVFFPVKFAIGAFIWAQACLAQDVILAFPFTGDNIMELVGMLLGLASLRTVEKIKGVAK
ncbi:hypothetical protein FGD67_06270 [Colwellia sp. M166]|uniref:hypothetical protein n=1 Tax=Colwellia sp. M166 TaxID=2583805 RepID=UPI00211EDF20|nr:hypothetical protein [Colwellia sp. M166]UUO22836.1 hypothetical protein FGD67_06270 [Colwellia sp. M166]